MNMAGGGPAIVVSMHPNAFPRIRLALNSALALGLLLRLAR